RSADLTASQTPMSFCSVDDALVSGSFVPEWLLGVDTAVAKQATRAKCTIRIVKLPHLDQSANPATSRLSSERGTLWQGGACTPRAATCLLVRSWVFWRGSRRTCLLLSSGSFR